MNSAYKKFSGQARHRYYLILILILSLSLNMFGIWWGQYHPDDVTSLALYMLKYWTLKPYQFYYPTLFTYVVLIFSVIPSKAFEILQFLSSGYSIRSAMGMVHIASYWQPSPHDYIWPRILAAIVGTCGIYLIYRLGKYCFSTRTGLLAALLLSVCMGYTSNSHYATTDVPVTVMMILAVWMCIRAHRKQTAGSYALAGLTIGLAASTKYYGIMAICPFILVHVDALRRKRINPHRLLFSLAFILLGFVVGTPHSILSFWRFAKEVLRLNIEVPIHGGLNLPIGYGAHLKNLINLLGVPLFAATVASFICSLAYLFKHRKIELACLWSLILPFYLVIGRMRLAPGRFILPIIPFSLLITAATFDMLLNAGKKSVRNLAAGALVAVVIYSLLYSLAGDFHFILDPKRMFLAWAEEHIPEGAKVEITSHCPLPSGNCLAYYRPHAGGHDWLYTYLERNKPYRFMVRQGIIWKHFLTRWELPPEKVINRAMDYHMKKEVPIISVRPDETFDYSLQGLYNRAPDYLVINHVYGWRFIHRKEDYPVQNDFFYTLLHDADTDYRRIVAFHPPRFPAINPSVMFTDAGISVYMKIADPPHSMH